jgi:membrane-associated protease RseP (regulator of RpoE activity)
VAWAAWFGMLATAMNLLPVGQLDGGHISYAVLGRRSTYVTFAMLGVAVLLIGLSPAWLFWILLMVLMLGVFGLRHPPTSDEYVPLDRSRLILAVFAVAMFILCFTPAPIREVASTFVR